MRKTDGPYTIDSLELGPMDNFIHIIADNSTGSAAVVDPAWDIPAIIARLEALQLTLSDILLTHSHADHINGLEELLAYRSVPVHISAEEAGFWPDCPADVVRHQDGEAFKVGQLQGTWLVTPGHTPGSSCFLFDGALLTGDTLFIFGCGRCDLHGGDPLQMYASLQRLKDIVPPQTRVYAGHNYGDRPSTDMALQTEANPFLYWHEVDDFVRYRMEIHDKVRDTPYGPETAEALEALMAQYR
ncbi:MBL fold metallo-hydrolase [Granulosicoccaceae sp. 1_MG-2023]|nr:MBL fold metallo-hydrolase [Granulosicoccaceae sp. 1_MG-2023]